jgi:hypothetical protein
MIPNNITTDRISNAIEEIKANGIPLNRHSTRYYLDDLNGNKLPPKYVVSIAFKKVTGSELDSKQFSGGSQTNNFLSGLGFTIRKGSSKS